MAREGRHLILRSRLVMFRYCPETHSGDYMGDLIFELMKECGALHKVCPVVAICVDHLLIGSDWAIHVGQRVE